MAILRGYGWNLCLIFSQLVNAACAADLDALPPPSWADKPYPRLRVEVRELRSIDRQCRSRHAGNSVILDDIIGCVVFTVERGRVVCTLILPHGYSQRLYRHERAHCNGWVHGY